LDGTNLAIESVIQRKRRKIKSQILRGKVTFAELDIEIEGRIIKNKFFVSKIFK